MDPTTAPEQTFNVVLNGGAFGILVFIAFFLIRNIPQWIKDHLATIEKLAEVHAREAKNQQDMFALQLSAERAMCDKHHDNVIDRLEKSNANTLAAFQAIEKSIDQHHDYAVAAIAAIRESAKHS